MFIMDRWMTVSKAKVDVDKLMSLLKSQIVSGNIQGAISTCQSSPSPVTRIIAAGLRRAGGSEHDVQQAMDEEALRELPLLPVIEPEFRFFIGNVFPPSKVRMASERDKWSGSPLRHSSMSCCHS